MLSLRGLSIGEYFATRDPLSGSVYYLMLLGFALMPLFLGDTCQASKLFKSTPAA